MGFKKQSLNANISSENVDTGDETSIVNVGVLDAEVLILNSLISTNTSNISSNAAAISTLQAGGTSVRGFTPFIVHYISNSNQTISYTLVSDGEYAVFTGQTVTTENGLYQRSGTSINKIVKSTKNSTSTVLDRNLVFVETSTSDNQVYYSHTDDNFVYATMQSFTIEGHVQTTNNNETEAFSIPVIEDRVTHIKVSVYARDYNSGDKKFIEMEEYYYNDSGSIEEIGINTVKSLGSSSLNSISIQFADLNPPKFKVTGIPTTTIDWHIRGSIQI